MTSLRFSHLGIAVSNIEKALSVYQELFGYTPVSGPFDDPIQKVSVCLVGTDVPGNPVIELVAPVDDDSPVSKMLARGVGAYHVCYEVDDIDQTLRDVRAKGCVVVTEPVPAIAFEGRRVAWFYTPTRQLVEIVEQ